MVEQIDFESAKEYVNVEAKKTVLAGRRSIIARLHILIGHKEWFISGSYANPNVSDNECNDIDIFFYDEESFDAAVANIPAPPVKKGMFPTLNAAGTPEVISTSDYAVTLRVAFINVSVQFVKTAFGTPSEVFKGFDLNVCKHAIVSSGAYIKHTEANSPLHITKMNGETIARYIKYIHKLKLYREAPFLLKHLVDDYIENHTIVKSYYEEDKPTTVNAQLMKVLMDTGLTWDKSYLIQQAKERSPELLL